MKYVIFSDLHGNSGTLDELTKIRDFSSYTPVFLGDAVEFGQELQENLAVTQLRGLPNLMAVRGNHDSYICETERHNIDPENIEFLAGLPEFAGFEGILAFHSSIHQPPRI